MLKRMLTTTAIAALLASGAFAQDTTTPEAPATDAPAMEAPATDAPSMDAPAMDAPAVDTAAPVAPTSILATGYTVVDRDSLATELIGQQVYSSQAADAEHIGNVNNFVIGENGQIAAVIIGVGGFLGIGEKNVAVNYLELEWVTAEDGSKRFVLPTTKEALEAAPDFEAVDPEDAPAVTSDPMAPAVTDPAPADPAVTDPAAPATTTN